MTGRTAGNMAVRLIFQIMIVSHKHQFIFIKPHKVGGTSVQARLSEQCADTDMYTKIREYSPDKDHDYYKIDSQNAESLRGHASPSEIEDVLGKDVWNRYTKITIVRNPWDLVVSSYHWENWRRARRRARRKKTERLIGKFRLSRIAKKIRRSASNRFLNYVADLPSIYLNSPYYFDANMDLIADVHIRYETLETDYKAVCDKLDIAYRKLPRLKTAVRNSGAHYSTYYDDRSRQVVEEMFKDQIEYFGYRFEQN